MTSPERRIVIAAGTLCGIFVTSGVVMLVWPERDNATIRAAFSLYWSALVPAVALVAATFRQPRYWPWVAACLVAPVASAWMMVLAEPEYHDWPVSSLLVDVSQTAVVLATAYIAYRGYRTAIGVHAPPLVRRAGASGLLSTGDLLLLLVLASFVCVICARMRSWINVDNAAGYTPFVLLLGFSVANISYASWTLAMSRDFKSIASSTCLWGAAIAAALAILESIGWTGTKIRSGPWPWEDWEVVVLGVFHIHSHSLLDDIWVFAFFNLGATLLLRWAGIDWNGPRLRRSSAATG